MACVSGLLRWRETRTRKRSRLINFPSIAVEALNHPSLRHSISLSLSLSDNNNIIIIGKAMDLSEYARKLSLTESSSKQVVRKAAELRRLSDLQFDSSSAGIGEICKSIICLEIAANMMQVLFDRQTAIRLSGMSDKAYIRSFNIMQNGIGIKNKLDIRELAIQFGCVRLIPLVQKGLSLYKERFIASLPPSRRASADFTRPVFTATGFYLCAKKHKLKVDKTKLIELSGTSDNEFSSVSTSMKDLCHDVFGVSKEKKDPKSIKVNRDLLDVLPEKRQADDGGYSSDESTDLSAYKKRKREENHKYDEWKSTVEESNRQSKDKENGGIIISTQKQTPQILTVYVFSLNRFTRTKKMANEMEELIGFLSSPSPQVKKAAVEIVRGLTGSEDGLLSLASYSTTLLPSLSRLLGENKEVSELAADALVNLSQNPDVAARMIEMGLIKVAMDVLYKQGCEITGPLVMLLVNLTQLDAGVESLLQVGDEKVQGLYVMKLVRSFCTSSSEKEDDPFGHVGSILVNVSKTKAGRTLLLDPKRGLLKQIIRQFDSTSLLRKKGVSGTIRNCCFEADNQLQNLLLISEFLWPALLLPVAGNKVYNEQDTSKMPLELGSALSIEREPVTDPEIRTQALEAIYLITLQGAGRRAFWSVNGPRILQIGYEEEEDPKVMGAYEQIGSLLVEGNDTEEGSTQTSS